ncbi:MAG: hypothetical protein Q8M05_19295 [Rhodoferax sp.]|uniref:hypothetical protein n=1 Tax=Rhodoferax sp. TaxID=50421 RepID=UPI002731A457|nr:hypothetical protein [Rhodoferax sp.]MDP1531516.1 hypothetical protein [Rhodoferax sp.]MDP1942946.1 hypothetical protein [Rhodoferax sp.]
MTKLFFCFPYCGVGGVPLLFLRIAEELSARREAETYLVDYVDGFMAKHRTEGLTHFVEYRDDVEVHIPSDAVAVFQSMTPWSIFPALKLSPQTRVLFWNCHPFNLVPTLPGLRRPMQNSVTFGRIILATVLRSYRDKMLRLVCLMLACRALVFMDRGNVATTERYLGLAIPDPVFLPIPAKTPGRFMTAPVRNFQVMGLRVAWVGRVVDFKYHILKKALTELNRLQPELDLRIEVTIVGSGVYAKKLRNDTLPMNCIDVHFIDHIATHLLDDFLLDQTDILMAMGTSALEGAKLGTPTLLLDVAYGEVPSGYLFQWLHERKGFSLGDVLGPEHIAPGNNSLTDRLREALSDYMGLSARATEHCKKFHSLPTVAQELLTFACGTTCTYGDLASAQLVERGVMYSIFNRLRRGLARE